MKALVSRLAERSADAALLLGRLLLAWIFLHEGFVLAANLGPALAAMAKLGVPAPLALGTMYWPEREPGATVVGFERLPAEPRRVLAGTINLVLQEPARMARHFDVASSIATGVPLFRVVVPPGVGAAELAVAIERHATELLAA